MSILVTLQEEMKAAMKARNQIRLDALRQIVSAIRYVEKDLPAQAGTPNLSDEQIVGVLKKEAKKRREAIEAYQTAGRDEQAKQEQYELSLIESYLPIMMSKEEVLIRIKEVLSSQEFANFGVAMSAVMGVLKGKADGGMVAKMTKELYTNQNKG